MTTAGAGTDALAPLARLRGVRAAVLASVDDGLVIAGTERVGLERDAVAAFGSALVKRVRAAVEEVGTGMPRLLTLDASGGRFIVATAGDLAMCVVADREAHPGLIRVTAQRVVERLSASPGTGP